MVLAYPKLVVFGIGLVITFVVGTAIGMMDNHQAQFSLLGCSGCLR